jgi:hypothetical protein
VIEVDYHSSKNQQILGEFVRKNVIYCVSSLVYELSKMESMDEELWDVLIKRDDVVDDNQFRYMINKDERGEFCADVRRIDEDGETGDVSIWDIDTEEAIALVEDGIFYDIHDVGEVEIFLIDQKIIPIDARVLAEDDDPETHDEEREAYEHWLVDRRFGEKLEEHGEMVIYDFMGLEAIWGRTCTGQAICMDHVIGEIAEEMEILEGQKYEWVV